MQQPQRIFDLGPPLPLWVGVVIFTFSLFAGSLWAQTGDILKLLQKQQRLAGSRGSSSLSVSPPLLDLNGPPGGIAETQLTVFNGSPYDGLVHLTPWEAREIGPGKVANVSDPAFLSEDSFVKNMTFSPPDPLLPSQTEKTITVRVKIPANLRGVRYGGIAVALVAQKGTQRDTLKQKTDPGKGKYLVSTGVGIGVSQGLILQLTAEPATEAEYQYEIEKIDITLPSAKTLLEAKATVKNPSPYILNAIMSAVVLDASNQMVTRLKPSAPARVHPGSSNVLSVSPSASILPKGKYRMVVTVTGRKMATKTIEKQFSITQ